MARRFVAGDFAIFARGELGFGDLVLLVEEFGGFAVVIAGLEGQGVGEGDGGFLGELGGDVLERRVERPAIEPVDQAEGEHVFAAIRFLGAKARFLGGGGVELVDGDAHEAIATQRAVIEGVIGVAGLAEVDGGEGIVVDDDDAAVADAGKIGLEGGGVHGDESVYFVAGGEYFGAGEVDLVSADAGESSSRGADFGGEIGEGADVVADGGGGIGELRPGELHAVAAVTGEANGDAGEGGGRLARRGGWSAILGRICRGTHSSQTSV